jgi:hypothetical protein
MPPITSQVVKSALELPWEAEIPAGRWSLLSGRSWSGAAAIAHVEVSTDDGATWRRATLHGPDHPAGWARWTLPWRPITPARAAESGRVANGAVLVRATDRRGNTQPDAVPFNTGGYLFGAVVRHPVTVIG